MSSCAYFNSDLQASKLLKEPPKPAESLEELNEDDGDETYFKDPQQLLDLFTGLEEQNVFLIQHVQEIEEGALSMCSSDDDFLLEKPARARS